MGRIILVTGFFSVFDSYGTEIDKEFVVSHGVDEETGRNVVVQCEHPTRLGAKFDTDLQEWVLDV